MATNHEEHHPIVISMEDPIIHSDTHPFCTDPTCPCHEDQELIAAVNDAVKAGLLTPEEATKVTRGKTL